ncbi:putative rRNA-processing protein [Pelagophyceae sp. CCMP2097]|nr:putative rRNA-processing protein [Pelagophyceae sp. CCMP2097]
MRLLRAKAARKTLQFYKVGFGLEGPYTVVLDGNFVHHALVTVKTGILPRLQKLLGKDQIYLAVPRAVIHELEALGETCAEALAFCTSDRVRLLDKKSEGGTAADAILKLVGERNENRYVVATQDDHLLASLRKVPGMPVLRFSSTVLQLDAPSRASLKCADRDEQRKTRLDDDEFALAKRIRKADAKQARAAGTIAAPRQRASKKRAGGANPLSCQKPKEGKRRQQGRPA